ncbi:SH3 domain-containing protein [Flammeovirga agarivorans]|uniref:SH3 domain-containing protein n=1 Tax=Flammeovirga agarivorans TaxID=2726742 RepID=A0A7X8XZF1_9BACT|nr:SH3 domain-containing protein [Flammeovirga agarivorans]NLR95117.1 SH3 domain-containing protein [Flammeovirga agarivorans]
MRFLIAYFFLFLSGNILSQNIGVINDKDGYTNIRKESTVNSNIIGVILEGQTFQYSPSENKNWYKLNFNHLEGFIHSSRVSDIKSLGKSYKFSDNQIDKNLPKYEQPTIDSNRNKKFTRQIDGKPITYFLNHTSIDIYSKMYYQGIYQISDSEITFNLLDSVTTDNIDTRKFYLFNFSNILQESDGALSEAIGSYCLNYLKKYPLEVNLLKTKLYQDNSYEKFISFSAFEIYFSENPYEELDNLFNDIMYNYSEYEQELLFIKKDIFTILKTELKNN